MSTIPVDAESDHLSATTSLGIDAGIAHRHTMQMSTLSAGRSGDYLLELHAENRDPTSKS